MLNNSHSSADVRSKVSAELGWDPKIDSSGIAVTAHEGAITLRGVVGSARQIREAGNAAQRVYGVTSVTNQLTVRPVSSEPARDSEVHAAVLHALMLNSTIPTTVIATVRDGVVRLSGTATWHWQQNEAEHACAAVVGVLGVIDDIKLTPAPADPDIQQAILAAFRRNARLILDGLSVDVVGSEVVILSGTVTTWAEHDEAVTAGWSAPGVTRVDDRIVVMY